MQSSRLSDFALRILLGHELPEQRVESLTCSIIRCMRLNIVSKLFLVPSGIHVSKFRRPRQ